MSEAYAGEIGSEAAFELLEADPEAILVDCRTRAEWTYVGVPVVDRVVFAEWTRYPDGSHNQDFLAELADNGVTPDHTVLFLCRSGQRSLAAARAATAAGYRRAFNVSDGFEGPLDATGRRTIGGWKTNGLPWRQS